MDSWREPGSVICESGEWRNACVKDLGSDSPSPGKNRAIVRSSSSRVGQLLLQLGGKVISLLLLSQENRGWRPRFSALINPLLPPFAGEVAPMGAVGVLQ